MTKTHDTSDLNDRVLDMHDAPCSSLASAESSEGLNAADLVVQAAVLACIERLSREGRYTP